MAKRPAKPEWLSEGVGYADVTLSRPAKFNGVEQGTLRMREPTVGDTEIVSEMDAGDATREIVAIANLCDVAPNDVRKLPLRDFKRLQTAYLGFTD